MPLPERYKQIKFSIVVVYNKISLIRKIPTYNSVELNGYPIQKVHAFVSFAISDLA